MPKTIIEPPNDADVFERLRRIENDLQWVKELTARLRKAGGSASAVNILTVRVRGLEKERKAYAALADAAGEEG